MLKKSPPWRGARRTRIAMPMWAMLQRHQTRRTDRQQREQLTSRQLDDKASRQACACERGCMQPILPRNNIRAKSLPSGTPCQRAHKLYHEQRLRPKVCCERTDLRTPHQQHKAGVASLGRRAAMRIRRRRATVVMVAHLQSHCSL